MKYKYRNKKNKFISFEEHKEEEQQLYIDYIDGIETMARKNNFKLVEDLCSRILNHSVIDNESIFADVHMFKTWYDKLFDSNKSQLLLDLCREQGYTVEIKELENIEETEGLSNAKKDAENEENKFSMLHMQEKFDLKLEDQNMINIYMEIGETKKKFAPYINYKDNIAEQIEQRMNTLGVFQQDVLDDDELIKIIFKKDVFEGCARSLPLHYSEKTCIEKQMNQFLDGIPHIEKDVRWPKRIKLLSWIENYLGIDRFHVNDIKLDDDASQRFITELRKQDDLLSSLLSINIRGKQRVINDINRKLKNVTSGDRIQKFVADIYNIFDKKLILYEQDRKINDKNKKVTYYFNFAIHKKCLSYHKKFFKLKNF
jgi:hypothetical protein